MAEFELLTVGSIFDSEDFKEDTLSHVTWLESERAFCYVRTSSGSGRPELRKRSVATGEDAFLIPSDRLVTAEDGTSLPIGGYRLSPDERAVLLSSEVPARFRSDGNYFLYSLASGKMRKLTDTSSPQRNAKFSPDGALLGFVRDDEIHVLDLATGEERRLTWDADHRRYNGRFGWVYEEELHISDGWSWSPDSESIAYFQNDESDVPEMFLPRYELLHQTPVRTLYPKAGDPNPTARIGMLNVATGSTRWFDLAIPEEHYLAGMQWTPDGASLLIQRIPRTQTRLELLKVDVGTGEVAPIIVEEDSAWVSPHPDVHFVGEGPDFLWVSDRGGYRHLYLYDIRAGMVRQITSGEWDVEAVAHVDASRRMACISAANPKPTERQVFEVGLDGSGLKRLTSEPGVHHWLPSPDGCYAIVCHSDRNTPPRVTLRRYDGASDECLGEAAPPALSKVRLGEWEYLDFNSGDGSSLHGLLLRPPDFDVSKRYPVLMHVYGGPGSQTGTNRWQGRSGLWYQMLAQEGFVVCTVDGRGTGMRGRDFQKCVHLRLGQLETQDQIAAARYLGELPYVDPERIGIWGWSYGGYMAAMCILEGADVFKAAAAVAPVTDWRLYDSIYTEKFMGTPEENPEGYDAGSPVKLAEKLRGKLLLMHGTMDDNVHFQNTVQFVDALQTHHKEFEVEFFPCRGHGIENRHLQVYRRLTDFFKRNL